MLNIQMICLSQRFVRLLHIENILSLDPIFISQEKSGLAPHIYIYAATQMLCKLKIITFLDKREMNQPNKLNFLNQHSNVSGAMFI